MAPVNSGGGGGGSFHKFFLVPEEEMLRKIQLDAAPPEAKMAVNTDARMEKLLEQVGASNISTEELARRYQQLQQKYLALRSASATALPGPSTQTRPYEANQDPQSSEVRGELEAGSDDDHADAHDAGPMLGSIPLLDMISHRYRDKASRLLRFIRNQVPAVSWNNHGELMINNRKIPRTHIVDLLQQSVQARGNRKHFAPGFSDFQAALRAAHAPRSLTGTTIATPRRPPQRRSPLQSRIPQLKQRSHPTALSRRLQSQQDETDMLNAEWLFYPT